MKLGEKRAQASIEQLMMIGGAVLVAVVVGFALKQAANSIGTATGDQIGR